MKYLPRVVDNELARRLKSAGAVVIEGPKACGKTTTGRQFAASEVLLDIDENAKMTLQVDPDLVLDGQVPRLIDEWQIEPKIWNHIWRAVDDRSRPGQFILTGSAVPSDDITRHTGAGRLTRIIMRPMSLFETGNSSGEISLKDLLNGTFSGCKDPGLTTEDMAKLICKGGWPIHLNLDMQTSLQAVRDYLEEIRRIDIKRIDQTKRNPEKVGRLLRSLARNAASTVSAATLASDTGDSDTALHGDTARDYLEVLSRLMIIEDQPAWAPHLRSRSRLRKSPKRHFIDPSLAVAALRAYTERLFSDMHLFGLLFESLVIRDLRVYSQNSDAKVYHYRDAVGLEVDAVIERSDGKWAAFEIKLGTGRIDESAENLLDFEDKIDAAKCGKPAVLGIITGLGFGYTRKDGVAVIPIGSLRP